MGKRKDQAKAVASEEAEGNGGGDVPTKKGKAAGGKKGALVAEPDSTVGNEANKLGSKGKKAKPVLADAQKDQEDLEEQDVADVAPDSVAAVDPEEAATRPKKGRRKNGAAVVEEKPGKEKPNKRAAQKADDASLTDLSPVKKPAGKGSRPRKIVEDASSSTEEVAEPSEGRRPKRNAAAAAAVAMAEDALAEKQFESKRKKKGDSGEGRTKQAPGEKKSRAKKIPLEEEEEEEEDEENIEEDEVKASDAEEDEEKPVVPVVKGKSAGKKSNKVAVGKNKKPADHEEDEEDAVVEAQEDEVDAG
ncbi:unnamed protein product, partial [Notodromas monacha]